MISKRLLHALKIGIGSGILIGTIISGFVYLILNIHNAAVAIIVATSWLMGWVYSIIAYMTYRETD